MTTIAWTKDEAEQIRQASTTIAAAYGVGTKTNWVNMKGMDQVLFDIKFTPAATNTNLYAKVLFREKNYRLLTVPVGGTIITQNTTDFFEQTMLDIANSTITNGVQTVGLNTIEYKISRATTNLISVQLPVKCLSYEVALDFRADNPGASQLDVWAVKGVV